MFKGHEIYSVDAKGRVSIPARQRKYISSDANDTLVMTQGTSPCIDIYPLDQWQQIEEKLQQLNPFDPEEALFVRMFLHYATECVLDSQSRILIPQILLQHAKIEKEVLVLGQLKKIELWNPQIYTDYLKQSSKTYEQVAQVVMTK